jgi:DNA gyrase/topoisomerase IV subunit B
LKFGNIKKDNFYFKIKHNESDDFSQCLIINGLYVRNGGTPINYIINTKIVPRIREKLLKKFPSIKPADIRNKMKILLIMRFFPKLEFSSQEKIEISNSQKDLEEFFKDVDWDKIVKQLLKDEDLMLSITEYFSLKQKAKENAELKKLSKKEKKIKSEKFFPAIRNNKYLFIAEGTSARSGLMNILGRNENAFYELKGVPLNAWEVPISKVNANTELKDLITICNSFNFEKIIIATDSDMDGYKISLLTIGNIVKYLPQYKDKIYRFYTPIAFELKNGKLIKWWYSLKDIPNKEVQYAKGLGRWTKKQLQEIINKDGLDNMIIKIENIDENLLDEWLSNKKSDKRKEYIKKASLDINKI